MNEQDTPLDLGPLEPLLADESVALIMVDGPDYIYVERRGRLEDTPYHFQDDKHLIEVINRIFGRLGRKIDESRPYMDARLVDGSRVNAVVPPASLTGPALTIRRFSRRKLTIEELIRYGSWNEDIVEFLRACVCARLNIIVAGTTGSGKTTLLNRIAEMIPDDERIITIENAAELHGLHEGKKYVVTLESRPPNMEGKGEITIRDLVKNATHMRPDRIVVGEVRGGEVLDLLEAMNTGHDGSMTSIHAGSPHNALNRLEMMVSFANPSLPPLNVRQMMASAIDLIIYQERMRDGSRKILKITEVTGMQGDVIMLQDVFEFRETGYQEGRITGYHTATGYIPKFISRIQGMGIELAMNIFAPK